VDLVVIPAALREPRPRPIGDTGRTWSYWRSKAWESCVFLALANRPGPAYAGGSGIWLPDVRDDRSAETVAGEEGAVLLTATIDTRSRYVREKRGMGWRHLHLYTPLVRRRTPAPPALPLSR
jgi:hypothetical protein